MTEGQELPNCELFDLLSPSQRHELLGLMEAESRPAGSAVVEEGKAASGLWVVTKGRCQVTKATPSGSPALLAELGPGAVIGEMTFFRPAPRSATVRALSEVELLKFTREAYSRLERDSPATAHRVAVAIAVILSERLQRMGEWAARVQPGGSKQRNEEWAEFRTKLYEGWAF